MGGLENSGNVSYIMRSRQWYLGVSDFKSSLARSFAWDVRFSGLHGEHENARRREAVFVRTRMQWWCWFAGDWDEKNPWRRAEIQTSVLLDSWKRQYRNFAILTLTTYEEYEAEVWDLKHFCPKLFDNLSFWNIRFVLRHFFHHMFHKASVSGSKQCGRCGRDVAANGWSQRLGDGDGSIDGDFCGGAPGTADFDLKNTPLEKEKHLKSTKKHQCLKIWRIMCWIGWCMCQVFL